MFEEFSAGYYVARFYVDVYDGDRAVMERSQHVDANEEIYATGDGVERLDLPLVMKLEEHHFPVLGNEGIPVDTLVIPNNAIEQSKIEETPTLREILVAKADRAVQFLEWFTPYTVAESANA